MSIISTFLLNASSSSQHKLLLVLTTTLQDFQTLQAFLAPSPLSCLSSRESKAYERL